VHAGSGHERDSLLARVAAYLGAAARAPGHRPGLVQRLDGDVSGVLVIGKTASALRTLTKAVAEDALDKRYLALAAGDIERDGTIDLSLAVAEDAPRGERTRADAGGVTARTDYRVLERLGDATLLELRIHTGRQHQIRAHLRAIGHPIVGDPRYGPAPARDPGSGLGRPFLHARSLAFTHPTDARPLRFEAPVPPELARVLRALRRGE
jgi:23S rRNA pseudouridine1911/1915/1917 synthase